MTRADQFLVQQGFAASRSEAQAAIRAGLVSADGAPVAKPSQALQAGATIAYAKPHPYVSRGGLKLAAALDHFNLSPDGRIALDIGASTGGFTEVLLAGGAARVYAVDVGHAQMNPRLARDPRIVRKDGVNARDLTTEQVPEPVQAIVADVSFIGLKLVLPPALVLAAPDAWVVALVKPQFEIGRWAVGKGGIVRDAEAQAGAIAEIEKFLNQQAGWTVLGHIESPITGGDGNREFLIAAQRG
jgi:23S rRNA (cytidine1920-2'-O)/16S rRNA (cytidine1409-2'-O)-methyltransferase